MNSQQKEQQLKELFQQKDAIQRKIDVLLEPQKIPVLPPDFSVTEEVFSLLKACNPNSMHANDIVTTLQAKFPTYGITRKQVNGALIYLKGKRETIDGLGRGIYRMRQPDTLFVNAESIQK